MTVLELDQSYDHPTSYDHPLMRAIAEIQVVPIGVGVSVLHGEGTTRLSTAIRLGTRADKEPSLAAQLR